MKPEPTIEMYANQVLDARGRVAKMHSNHALTHVGAVLGSNVVHIDKTTNSNPILSSLSDTKPTLNSNTRTFDLNLMHMELVPDMHKEYSGNDFTYIEEGSNGFGSYAKEYIDGIEEPSPYIKSFINDFDEDKYKLVVEEYYRLDPELGEDWEDEKPYRAEYNDMNQYENDCDAWSRAKPTDGYSSVNVFVIKK